MKKSLIIRWIVVIAVIAAWTAALFPIRDKDFVTAFKAKTEKLARQFEADGASVAAAKAKLDAIQDKESEEYKTASAEFAKLAGTPEYLAWEKAEDYAELMRRIEELRKANPEMSGYKAVEQAARGNAETYSIRLGDYYKIPFSKVTLNNSMVLSKIRQTSAGKLHLGLDLQGGTEFVIGFDKANVPPTDSATGVRDKIIEILRNRVDALGVAEPELKAMSEDSISVRMPSVDEADKADIRTSIKQAAKLSFHLVATNNADLVAQYEADRKNFKTPANLIRSEIVEGNDIDATPVTIFINKEAEKISGSDIDRAQASITEFGGYSVALRFNGRGARAFADVTGANVGRRLAIVLDGKIYSAPNIREAIPGGNAEITGNFSPEEATRLAGVIASGNLPVSIDITSEFGTDPTLGADSIKSGAMAGVLGLVLVVLFMVWYYKFAGIVAVIALIVNTVLVFGTMSLTRATITLPGLAGMVLTIGMAVDANVLIFERIREELNQGKAIANAITAGYSRAFSSIFDSNLTTLLTCFFLYKFGTGSVKGFAVTLAFGIFASMFTALFMTHAIFDLMTYKNLLSKLTMRTFTKTGLFNIDFIKAMRPAVIVSIVFIVISLGTAIVRHSTFLGIDFRGGTQFTYDCNGNKPDVDKIRAYLSEQGYDSAKVGYKRGQGGEEQLEIALLEVNEDANVFGEKLDKAFPECKIDLAATYAVGGSVGSQFCKAAIWAIIMSFLGVIIYLSFRFEFIYGLGAVIAVVHDVLVSAGLFLLLNQGQLSLTTIAALMTIFGYSLNDTIVIFDRMRETQTLEFRSGLSYDDLINKSLNHTLSRTLLTTLTTLLVVISLLVFGGGAIREFAFVMFYGMFTGTYSSIFIATAIVRRWHKGHAADGKANAKAPAKA